MCCSSFIWQYHLSMHKGYVLQGIFLSYRRRVYFNSLTFSSLDLLSKSKHLLGCCSHFDIRSLLSKQLVHGKSEPITSFYLTWDSSRLSESATYRNITSVYWIDFLKIEHKCFYSNKATKIKIYPEIWGNVKGKWEEQ